MTSLTAEDRAAEAEGRARRWQDRCEIAQEQVRQLQDALRRLEAESLATSRRIRQILRDTLVAE